MKVIPIIFLLGIQPFSIDILTILSNTKYESVGCEGNGRFGNSSQNLYKPIYTYLIYLYL